LTDWKRTRILRCSRIFEPFIIVLDHPTRPAPEMEPSVTDNQTRPTIEISGDEDWKNRVKAEDAALDQQFRDKGGPASGPGGGPAETSAPSKPDREESTSPQAESETETQKGKSRGPRAADFPPASFETLLAMLSTQAMVALGIIPSPGTKQPETQLPLARYLVDLIDVLEKKTAGNLSDDEAAALDETLHSLRMAYVHRSKEAT
jgi:hypothetical protein